MAFLMARSGLCLLALAIALGAFGAHGLESMVTDERLVTWETAVRYQAWLSLVLIGLGLSRLSQARWVFPLLVSGMCILLALAVALGAFGAHGLESMVTDERLVTWETAVRYQAWLSLVLIGLGLSRLSQTRWVFPLLVSGMCIFSGSLYLLVLLDLPILGAITPIGGVLMMIGLVLAAVSLKPQS